MISSPIKTYVIRFCIIVLICLIGAGTWVVYTGISTSLRAERALHAINMMTIVNEQFIEKEGKWPQYWEDLIAHTAAQQYSMYSWPDDCMRIREYVKIDFDADPTALAWWFQISNAT